MASESNWGFSVGDEHSGFAVFGFACKADAQAAMAAALAGERAAL